MYHNQHVVAFLAAALSNPMFMSDEEHEDMYMELKQEEFMSEHQLAPDYSKPNWGIPA